MNTLETMDGSISRFSKTDRAIYEAIRKFPDTFATSSVTQLSQVAGFSKPALTRFAQRLGFGGFVEFQYEFAKDLKQARQRSDSPSAAEVYGGVLKEVEERMDQGRLQALLDLMYESHHTYIMGYNLSRICAEELNMALRFCPAISASSPQTDVEPRFRTDDLLIVFSAVSGASYRNLLQELKSGRNARPHMVLVTTNSKHPLRHSFDEVFVLPTASLSVSDRTVLSDTFAFLMFNDMLCALMPPAG